MFLLGVGEEPHFDEHRGHVRAGQHAERGLLKQRNDEAESSASGTMFIVLYGTLCCLALSGALAYFVIRGVNTALRQAVRKQDNLAQGELLATLRDIAGDLYKDMERRLPIACHPRSLDRPSWAGCPVDPGIFRLTRLDPKAVAGKSPRLQ